MFAISFDLVVEDVEIHHPRGMQQAYGDIAKTLKQFGFRRIQGSVYMTDDPDMSNLLGAIRAASAPVVS